MTVGSAGVVNNFQSLISWVYTDFKSSTEKADMVICKPHPTPKEVKKAVERWTAREKNRLFALITDGQHPHTFINRALVRQAREEYRHFEGIETLDVIVDSSGGEVDAAYQLVTFLRTRCKKLRVFVPDWAKSAASFFCLGADEIWMSEIAELGPLDAQIPDPKNPEDYISALEEFRAMDYLKRYAFETLDEFVFLLIRRTAMRLRDIIPEARSFVTDLMKPLYEQVDPFYFGASHRTLDIAIEYGKRLMPRYAYKDWSPKKIDDLLQRLTWRYPSHSFVIDYNEAKSLELNVNLLEGEQDEDMRIISEHITDCVGLMDIELLDEEPGDKNNGGETNAKDNSSQKESQKPTESDSNTGGGI